MSSRVAQLLGWESQCKQAVRDGVNRPSRKPFVWGGLVGYRQLGAVADAVRRRVDDTPETAFLRQLLLQVERAVAQNRALAQDLEAAHTWLRRIAAVLHYPRPPEQAPPAGLSRAEVAAAMQQLLAEFQPEGKRQPAQTALYDTLSRTWLAYGSELLHGYDIPGLPPDHLDLEALFSRLRRHQRRISGRKSTLELREFAHYQVLCQAQSEQELLQQLRTVPLSRYRQQRRRLQQAGEPRRFLHRLHRDPHQTMQHLANLYITHQHQLKQERLSLVQHSENTS